jgi:hypothetical protein
MTSPQQVPFDQYLDAVFASPTWLEACVSMLAAFLESIDSCRDSPGLSLPQMAPPIVDQVSAIADRAQHLELQLRTTAESHGSVFQTSQLRAVF